MNELSKLTFSGRDEFNRKGIAEKIIQLLESDIEVTPMLIEGEWGTGKTEFCYKLINLIDENTSLNSIYIDAYAEDHLDDPLIMILGNLSKYIEQNLIETKPEIKEKFFKAAIPVVKFLLKTSLKAGVNLVLKQNADTIGEELQDTIKEAGEEAINGTVETIIKDQEKAQENINQLKAVIEIITQEAPLIIFIDELDRCRPDFSLKLLEKIKHVFEVANLKFVLLANRAQLVAGIKHTYGYEVEAERYLDKFFKFSFKLSGYYLWNLSEFRPVTIEHFKNQLSKFNLSSLNASVALEFISALVQTNNISLREAETFVRNLGIYKILWDDEVFNSRTSFGFHLITMLSIFCICFKPKICIEIENETIDPIVLCELLGVKKYTKFSEIKNPTIQIIISALIMAESKKIKDVEDIEMLANERNRYFQGDQESILEIMNKAIRSMRLAY